MAVRRDPQIQALGRGLEILDLLLDAEGPVTGGELARRVGLHESSVSRILQTLIRGGYVKRVPGGNVPALRLLRFARVTAAFPVISGVRPVLEQIAAERPGHHVNLCAYGQGELVYLARCQADADTITGLSFPLHGSSAAMRLLTDLPEAEALAALRASRARHGWTGGPQLPADEGAALTRAREQIRHDVLVLSEWAPGATSAAIPLTAGGEAMALAIGGATGVEPTTLRLWLHEARRRVEEVLDEDGVTAARPRSTPAPTDPPDT